MRWKYLYFKYPRQTILTLVFYSQRRCNLEDERDMRALLTEGDLVCVEVQKICDDGLMRLAARSIKFGKVRKHFWEHVYSVDLVMI